MPDRCSDAARLAVLRLQSDPEVFLLHCLNCQGYSASHMPRQEFLSAYYKQYHNGREKKVTFFDSPRIAKHVLRLLSPLPEHARILDFGGGDGSIGKEIGNLLLKTSLTKQIDLMVVDYETPTQADDDRFVYPANNALEIKECYNLVLASAVLEHIPDLHDVLKTLLGLVAPGGYFYARTPSAVPLKRIFPSIDLTYPAHVHDLGSAFWNCAAETFRFKGTYVASGPSIVATSFREAPIRSLSAHLLKLPAQVEQLISPSTRRNRIWNLVGGWEVVLRNDVHVAQAVPQAVELHDNY